MSQPFWLYRWIDEFEIKNQEDLDQVLRLGRKSMSRLQEIAANETWTSLDPYESPGAAILAGRGADLSGDMDCCNHVCQQRQVDELFNRVLYYFDEIVVSGPPAYRYAEALDSPNIQVIDNLREHLLALIYLRKIGAASMISFVQKPPACSAHYLQHAQEAGVLDVVDRGRSWIDELAKTGNLSDISRHEDHWHYTFNHPAFEHTQWGVVGPASDGSDPAAPEVAEAVYARYAAHLVSDVLAARQLGLPLGPFMKVHAATLATNSSTVTTDDVAFELQLPILSRLPLREVISIRNHEKESFLTFQRSLTHAIQERIDAGEGDPRQVAARIIDEVISPALNDISLRLTTARKSLEWKSGLSAVAGIAVTTVGLLSGVPLIAGMGIAALGTTVSAAHKYLDDKSGVRLEDMYFLWRLEERGHRHGG